MPSSSMMRAILAVAPFLLTSALPTPDRSALIATGACRESVKQLSASPIASDEAKLMDVCRNVYDFSESACGAAKEVLAGRKLQPELASPLCSALVGPAAPSLKRSAFRAVALDEQAVVSEHESTVAAALVQRGQQGAKNRASAKLETAVRRKSGLPREEDYLVKSANPVNYPTIVKAPPNNFPPVASVDQTIAMPPDSNGDFWDTPADGWVENAPPTAAALAVTSAPTPA
mmetsp:Transcript_84214/g.146233  ORF Transcript_84214/g.146233 Transcript_84214/m.146233 type:complete len:231 (+) Transcript_84214:64-756(+)